MLLLGRQIDHRIEEQINGLIEGQPFEQVVNEALNQLRRRWTGHLVCFSTIDATGQPLILGDDLPEPLSPLATSSDGSLPWERAAQDKLEIHVGLDELDVFIGDQPGGAAAQHNLAVRLIHRGECMCRRRSFLGRTSGGSAGLPGGYVRLASTASPQRRPEYSAPWMEPVSRWSPQTNSPSPSDTRCLGGNGGRCSG